MYWHCKGKIAVAHFWDQIPCMTTHNSQSCWKNVKELLPVTWTGPWWSWTAIFPSSGLKTRYQNHNCRCLDLSICLLSLIIHQWINNEPVQSEVPCDFVKVKNHAWRAIRGCASLKFGLLMKQYLTTRGQSTRTTGTIMVRAHRTAP